MNAESLVEKFKWSLNKFACNNVCNKIPAYVVSRDFDDVFEMPNLTRADLQHVLSSQDFRLKLEIISLRFSVSTDNIESRLPSTNSKFSTW